MGLADEVLALHRAIRNVMIIENRTGELRILDEAMRDGQPLLNGLGERERDALVVAPTMILGAASQVGNIRRTGEVRLVGMLYAQQAVLCVPITDDSYLMVTTVNESFLEVMNTLQHALPNIIQKGSTVESLTVNSAVEADQAVRAFFTKTRLCEPNSVHLEDATLNPTEHSWQISGSYRPAHAVRTKRYYIELDAKTGAVTKFQVRA